MKCGPSYVKLPVWFSHREYHGKKIFNYIWKDVYHILLGENNSIICIGVQSDYIFALVFFIFPQNSLSHASTFLFILFFLLSAYFHLVAVCSCFMKHISSSILLRMLNSFPTFSLCILQQSAFSEICLFLLFFREEEIYPFSYSVAIFHGLHFFLF